VYNNILIDYAELAKQLGIQDVTYIPISALDGDNLVDRSTNLPWYEGDTLLNHLENVSIADDINLTNSRFPVQYVVRPQTEELHDYRGYAGKIISGIYKVGDSITVLPSGVKSKVSKIELGGKEVEEAFAPQSIILHLADDVDVSRGDVIVNDKDLPQVEQELEVVLCWMDSKPLTAGKKYLLQINSTRVRSVVKDIAYKLNVNTLEKELNNESAGLNDIVKATIKTAIPVAFDSYKKLRVNGGAILIDETSNVTVGACMIQ
jgi:sulfate adenylyltransferase subunit 1